MELYHPELRKTIEATPSQARVLKRSGWVKPKKEGDSPKRRRRKSR